MTSDQDRFFQFIDDNSESFISRLTSGVAIPSVSDSAYPRDKVRAMGIWVQQQLQAVGVDDTRLAELPDDPVTQLPLPPLVLGRVGTDTSRKTVLVYGHYDVVPANLDGWKQQNPDAPDPFVLTPLPSNGGVKLVGRGSTDDKGPVTGWLNVLQARKDLGLDFPVNIRFLFEGMEEQASTGLEAWIKEEAAKTNGFFAGVDCVCITDNYWLTTRRPVLTYGVRGITTFSIEITGATNDLHSGMYGRMIHEPMTDLVKLLGKLVDTDGVITVPGVEALVPAPTEAEKQEYRSLDFTVDDLVQDTGNHVELSEDPAKLLMGRMRYPSLSIHAIEGGQQGVIPHQVIGRFSLRCGPIHYLTEYLAEPQTPDEVAALVVEFLYDEFDKLASRNTIKVNYIFGAFPWVGDRNHWNFQAADAATQTVYGPNLAPDYTREGGTIPLALLFQEQLNANVLMLPMGRSDDGAHSLSEKLDVDNYVKGTKVFGAYLYEIARANAK